MEEGIHRFCLGRHFEGTEFPFLQNDEGDVFVSDLPF